MNTKSSTKIDLVGVDDTSPHIIWENYFLKSHNYNMKENILNQDTNRTILPEERIQVFSSMLNGRYFLSGTE